METGNTFLPPTCLQRRLINRTESGNGEDLLPIPTVGEPNNGHLLSALHTKGGIYRLDPKRPIGPMIMEDDIPGVIARSNTCHRGLEEYHLMMAQLRQHVQYYATILPQVALASTNSEAEMAELAEITFNLQSCLRRVATLLGELEGQAGIAFD